MTERRFALIVASYQYADSDLQKLVAPAQDAQALASVLKDRTIGGFDVKILLNEPSYKVNEEIETFFNERQRGDLLVVYFSCHGIKDEDGQLYFATTNTRRKLLGSTAVSANFVNNMMSRSRSRRQLLLLDCCYSGAFAKGMLSRADKNVHTGDQFEGRGRVVLTASDAMQYSFEGDSLSGIGERSIFSNAIVYGLKTGEADHDKNGLISYTELYDYAYDRVIDETPLQKPNMWVFGLEGNIVIAKNPNREKKTKLEEPEPRGEVPVAAKPEEVPISPPLHSTYPPPIIDTARVILRSASTPPPIINDVPSSAISQPKIKEESSHSSEAYQQSSHSAVEENNRSTGSPIGMDGESVPLPQQNLTHTNVTNPKNGRVTKPSGRRTSGPGLKRIPSDASDFTNPDDRAIKILFVNVYQNSTGSWRITGQIQNMGNKTLNFIIPHAQLVDANENVVGLINGFTRNSHLPPRESSEIGGLAVQQSVTGIPVSFKLGFEWK